LKANFKELSALCSVFGFDLEIPSFRLAQLETALEGLKKEIGRLSGEVSVLRGLSEVVTQLSGALAHLRARLSALHAQRDLLQPLMRFSPPPCGTNSSDSPSYSHSLFRSVFHSLLFFSGFIASFIRPFRTLLACSPSFFALHQTQNRSPSALEQVSGGSGRLSASN
jgi:hypothetical protein